MMTSDDNMPGFLKQNNLGKSLSPYLLQHSKNPVWWQEWKEDVIAMAFSENKPVFVSVGYSTCHWCHVMAAEAFSDNETAQYLNENYISIKIDREQRPDIDQFLMNFIQSQSGSGGWPLNVFLTPRLNPVVAITYAPLKTKGNMLSFLEIARRVKDYMESNADSIPDFVYAEQEAPTADPDNISSELNSYYDPGFAGFGYGQKFPPHSILLYLLYSLSVKDNDEIRGLCSATLDMMQMRGLNDHLRGGIFRYCTDREWTIPHFEKMLYDQALALWTYSLAYRVLGKDEYWSMAMNIIRCLEDLFENDGLYYSAFNADTDHREGATYLWNYSEIKSCLEPEEFKRFIEVYQVSRDGNFEGLNHLVRKSNLPLPEAENKLLSLRNKRKQPSRDDKIISGINALTAAAMIQAGRLLNMQGLEEKASGTVKKLLDKFWDGQNLGHSYFEGSLQRQSFLSDAGALLTAVTMLFESDEEWLGVMTDLAYYTESFKEDGTWLESKPADFRKIPASWHDQPVPSGISLAEMGLLRFAILMGRDYHPVDHRRPVQSDFYNISALISKGFFHVYTSLRHIPWKSIPVNSIQKRGEPETDCYNGTCKPLD